MQAAQRRAVRKTCVWIQRQAARAIGKAEGIPAKAIRSRVR
jgi:hypothetical protein